MTSFFERMIGGKKNEDVPPPVPQHSILDTKTLKFDQYLQMASEGVHYAKKRGGQLIEKAKEHEDRQHKVIAVSRTVFDMTAISLGPIGGAVGGVVGVLDSETTKQICDKIDRAMQGVWRDLSFEQKLLGLGSGVGLGILAWFVYVPVLTYLIITVANVYAVKRGADFVVSHKSGEAIITRQKKLLEQAEETEHKD